MMKKTFISIGIAFLLIIAGNIANAGYSDGGPHPAGNCPDGKICGWMDIRNVYNYGVPYSPATQNFYNDGPTADHLCQVGGYDSYTYQAVGGRYDKCNDEYSVVWKNGAWSSSKCTSSKWLAQIYCAKSVPNTAPTISWTTAPASAQCNAWYQVEASGHDNDGNMVAVSVDKNGTPFAYGDGGNGTDNTSGNGTSDGSPQRVTYTAWSQDSTGAQSPVITHSVNIGACVPTVVSGCTNPSASNYNPSANQDDGSCVLPEHNPGGWLDSASCDVFNGWASDADSPDTAIDVHFYADGNFVGAINANAYRGDVGGHGYSFATPASLKDNVAHSIYVYGINVGGGNNALLAGSGKTIQCQAIPPSVNAPAGYISVFPATIPIEGSDVTVSWVTVNASTCNASSTWSGAKGTSGNEVIHVSRASTFNLACTGPGGIWNGSGSVAVDFFNVICEDPNAANYGGALPCSFNPPASSCQDPIAKNYGNPLPCTYEGGNGGPSDGFTITADQNKVSIKFLGPLSATSTERRINVNPVGAFTNQVILSVADIRGQNGDALPADTIATYAFDNKAPSVNSSTVLTYNSNTARYIGEEGVIGSKFQIAFSKPITQPYKVTIRGASGELSSLFVLTVDPNTTDPNFEEI